MSFSPVYVRRVLDPSFANWKRLFAEDALRVHKAHLVMLAERKLIPTEAASAIRRGIDEIEKSFTAPEHIPDGVEDLYFLFEQELSKLIGMERAGYLHTARSRNDMDTTVFRLALKRELIALLGAVSGCAESFIELSRASMDDLIILYTHGQPANVSTLAHYLTAFLLEMLESADSVVRSLEIVDRSSMGACAITTTGFAIDRFRVSELLGFRGLVMNSYMAISTSHWLTAPSAAVAALMTDITRFAADLGHKASSEVGIVTFPDELVQISSIMPQKRNPVIIEHTRIQAGLARGELMSVVELFANVPFQDVNEVADAPVERLFSALAMAVSTIELLRETVRKVSVSEERVRSIALEFGTTTTELADTLVRELGISFREAHGATQAFVRASYDKGALRRAYRELRGEELPYSDERIDEILSPDWFVEVRSVAGGPSADGMAPVIEESERGIAGLKGALAEILRREELASAALQAAYRKL